MAAVIMLGEGRACLKRIGTSRERTSIVEVRSDLKENASVESVRAAAKNTHIPSTKKGKIEEDG